MANKKKVIKIVIICLVFAALLAGLITLMVLPQDYGTPDKLEIAKNNFGMRLWIGAQVAMMGLGTVFLMLILLIFMVTIMKYIFIGAAKIKEKKAASAAPIVEEVRAIEGAVGEDDEEVVAVIMAALNAYYESQEPIYKSNLKFKVRSIKEIK